MARSADIERGVPFLMPRTAYVNLALVAVAFGMFGLRYGIHRSLDLGSPLVHINFDGLFGTSPQVADARPGKRLGGDGRRDPNAPVDPWNAKTNDSDPATDAALQSVADPDPNNASTSPDASAKADAKNTEQLPPGTNPLDSGEKGRFSSRATRTRIHQPGPIRNRASRMVQRTRKDAKDANQSGSSGDNSSLGSKLRDALSNLLAKMKPQSKQGGGKPNDSSQSASTTSSQQGEKQEGDSEIARPGAGRRQREFAVGRRAAAGRDAASLTGQERRAQQQSTELARRQERHRQAGRRQGRSRSRRIGSHGKDQRDHRQARRQYLGRSDGGSFVRASSS